MSDNAEMPFWDHVEVLRKIILRCMAMWCLFTIGAFCLKKEIFSAVFAPAKSDFILYRLLCDLSKEVGLDSICPSTFEAHFINTELTSQFMAHLQMAMCVGLIFACPYLIIEMYRFVSPALYSNERKYSYQLIGCSFLLFFTGVLLNYFLIFPFTFRFLSTYQVDEAVVNQIALSSYVSTLLLLSLLLGLLFEIPIIAFFLAKLGLINSDLLKEYRRHAIVIIFIIAALITPTADVFTLCLVSIPIIMLYELSILVVRKTSKI